METILKRIIAGSAIGFGYYRLFKREVKAELKRSGSLPESILTENDLRQLPEPVKQYIRYTGSVGKPKVNNFRIGFTGKIRKDELSAWIPFTSEQYNFIDSSWRLFFMKAVMKGLPVAGYHCFKNGEAFMDIRL
jgi:hypothetical protein